MGIPFTRDEFLRVFHEQNTQLWPIQWLTVGLSIFLLAASIWRGLSTRVVLAALAGFWILNGVAYHWLYFTEINPVAWAFGALFIVEGLALWPYAWKPRGSTRVRPQFWPIVGFCVGAYALIGYPLVGYLAGSRFPDEPIIGMAPCPTVIFTIGLLLMSPYASRWFLALPIAWSLVGSNAISLGVVQDIGLAISGVAALGYVATPLFRPRRTPIMQI